MDFYGQKTGFADEWHIDTNCLFGHTITSSAKCMLRTLCVVKALKTWAQFKWHVKINMQSLKPQN
jgi:hypothetical protein